MIALMPEGDEAMRPIKTDHARLVAVFAACVLAPFASFANAGDMDALGAIYIVWGVYCIGVVVISLAVLFACRWIVNRTARALVRLSILLLVLTPVPMPQGYGHAIFVPAFNAVATSLLGLGASRPRGFFGHPILISYAGAFALFVPVVLAWRHLSRRYGEA